MSSAFKPFDDLLQLLFPRRCCGCGRLLVGNECEVCVDCLIHLPLTRYAMVKNNPLELAIGGKIPCVAATSYLYFVEGEVGQHIVHAAKYHGQVDIATIFGRQLGKDILDSGRFNTVDAIVPVPLHWLRKFQRGYNQSEILCKGIAKIFDRPVVTDVLYRNRYTSTQTKRNSQERTQNVANAFSVRDYEILRGKHVLLVDDVITSGATMEACWNALKHVDGIRISIASLAYACDY